MYAMADMSLHTQYNPKFRRFLGHLIKKVNLSIEVLLNIALSARTNIDNGDAQSICRRVSPN